MNDLSNVALSQPLLKVLIVSDVLLFREGIGAKLAQLGDLCIVGSVSPAEAEGHLRNGRVDAVILDASRRRAFAHVSALRGVQPDIRIIAFGIGGHQDALAGAEAGVCAFVGENGSVNDIHDAVRMAARGESYCPPKLTACLIDHIASMARHIVVATPSRLTEREREVASMVGDGLSNKEIAGMLRISPATVKNHVHNILDKLDLPSRSAIGGRLEVTARAA